MRFRFLLLVFPFFCLSLFAYAEQEEEGNYFNALIEHVRSNKIRGTEENAENFPLCYRDYEGKEFTTQPPTTQPPTTPILTTEPPAAVVVAATSKEVGSVAAATGGLSGSGITAAQAGRANVMLKLSSCAEGEPYMSEDPEFVDSPTGIVVGNNAFKYDVGTIVGNSLIILGIIVIDGGLNYWKGPEISRFPSFVSVPVMFVATPAISSATTLARLGNNTGTQILGYTTMVVYIVGTGAVTYLFLPSNFHSVLDATKDKWIDVEGYPGFTKKHGLFFDFYRQGRQWFVVVDFAMNFAAGLVSGFVPEQEHCNILSYTSIAIYGGYATAVIVLRPYESMVEQCFFSSLAVAQTVPLVLGAVNDTVVGQSKPAQFTATWLPSVIYGAMTLYSAYDLSRMVWGGLKKVYRWYSARKVVPPEPEAPAPPPPPLPKKRPNRVSRNRPSDCYDGFPFGVGLEGSVPLLCGNVGIEEMFSSVLARLDAPAKKRRGRGRSAQGGAVNTGWEWVEEMMGPQNNDVRNDGRRAPEVFSARHAAMAGVGFVPPDARTTRQEQSQAQPSPRQENNEPGWAWVDSMLEEKDNTRREE